MPITVIRDDDMPTTAAHIAEIRKVARFLGMTTQQCDEQLRKVNESSEPLPLIHPDERDVKENYRIESDGECCGAVTLTRDPHEVPWEASWEIDVFVYEKYRKTGAAEQAIADVLSQNPKRNWSAKFYRDNPFAAQVQRLLEKSGFIYQNEMVGDSGRAMAVYVRGQW